MTKAVELFTAVPRQYNCAQAVAAGSDRSDLISELASAGGGRAPGNRCGALHAAMLIVGDNAEAIRQEFTATLGSESCSILKNEFQVPCVKCVECAAQLLEKFGKKN